jgi:putative membrane protein
MEDTFMLPRFVLPVALAALLTAAASVGQPQTLDPSEATTRTTPVTPANPLPSTSTPSSGQLQGHDATFLRKAMESDRHEIASAKQALDSAERSSTKATAQMILDDHELSSQQLQKLASRKGWSMTTMPDAAESDQARKSPAPTPGAGSFDDRFTADQIRAHREAISLYRAQAASGSDPELIQFARNRLPHLERHLEMLQGSQTPK